MGETRRSSKDRQIELVDAALSIIADRGISALTTRLLAKEVGLSSGAIFRHFASLDDLMEAVVSRVESVLDSTYPAEDLPPAERLRSFIEARSAAVGQQQGILRLVISDQFFLALPKGESERLSACVKRTRKFVVECLKKGQESGAFRSDLSAPALAIIVLGTVQILALSTLKTGAKSARAKEARDALFVLIKPSESSSSKKKEESS